MEHKRRPTLRFKCLEYGHRSKIGKEQKCRKCHGVTETEKCLKEAYEIKEELTKTQIRDRVNRGQARIIMSKNNPNFRMNYANAVKAKSQERSSKTETSETKSREPKKTEKRVRVLTSRNHKTKERN